MAWLSFDNVSIAALAGALPENVQEVNLDPAHPRAAYIKNFVRQTGIKRRHISITEQTATDLGFVAVNAALERAGWKVDDLDGLVFLTQTPDFNMATGNSFVMHNHLRMRQDAFVFDIAQGCASFPYGLAVCSGFLQQPGIKRVAMVSGDSMWPVYGSKEALLNEPAFLTGDGSVAMLLEKKADNHIDIGLYSDGSGYSALYHPMAGARHAWREPRGLLPNGELYEGGSYMDGMEITAFSTMRVVESIKEFLAHFHLDLSDFEGLVLHQANMQIVKTMARRLKMSMDKVPVTVEKLANTNGASVSLTMIDAYAGLSDKLKLLISAFGIGLSWGVVSLTIDPKIIVPMLTTDFRLEDDFLKPAENR